MYIAGLNISTNFIQNQGVEGLVLLSTGNAFIQMVFGQAPYAVKANKEAGAIKSLPTTFIGRLTTPTHLSAQISVPVIYAVSVALNGLRQPDWMGRFSFPVEADDAVGVEGKAWMRAAASVGLFGCIKLFHWTLRNLGAQWHFIGVREKPSIVSTGPYAYVRHPLYSVILAQQVFLSCMFWSYVPLAALGVIATVFAIKMPIEEQLMERDPNLGAAYEQYKKRVTARVIPFIW